MVRYPNRSQKKGMAQQREFNEERILMALPIVIPANTSKMRSMSWNISRSQSARRLASPWSFNME